MCDVIVDTCWFVLIMCYLLSCHVIKLNKLICNQTLCHVFCKSLHQWQKCTCCGIRIGYVGDEICNISVVEESQNVSI